MTETFERKAHKPDWQVIIRWVGTALSIGILIWLLYQTGWQQVWEQVKQLAWWRIVGCLVLVFVSRLATWGRWHTLLQVQEVKVKWQDSLRLTFAGLFASNVLPTTIGGDVARLAGAVRIGVDPAVAAASLMADRLVGMTGMFLMAPFAIPALLQRYRKNQMSMVIGLAFAAPYENKWWKKIKRGIEKVFGSFKFWLKHPVILLKALGFTFIHMAAIYGIVTLLIEGMGEKLPIHLIAGIWSLTYFISLLPVSKMKDYQAPPQVLKRIPAGHYDNFIQACKGGEAPCSHFGIAGPFTEWLLLGSICWRFPNEKLLWDGDNLRFTNKDQANEFVKPTFRKGWELTDVQA